MKKLLIFCFALLLGIPLLHANEGIMDEGTFTSIFKNITLSDQKPITVIKYTDADCPFCIRHAKETQPELERKYGKTVQFIIKNNRGVNHTLTEAKAIAMLCVRRYSGYRMSNLAYRVLIDNSETTNPASVSVLDRFSGFVTKKYRSQYAQCVKNQETMSVLDNETQEAQSLGLSGTPGFLVINTKTKKYITIEGAYPFETFEKAIESLK